ncbi:spermidine synthase [Plesiocystis pacifica SIR-1]|uniref:Polyamine aminopropyltransferase n=1 Tax=Plesiocystis pacifica SIR-1 TaxID=391625 RepID=A6GCZ8_9BACT|nr:polyamine aminopropyltransferase [Plesiocystis pacifica]EDM76236.1 spermidine synthase [Plesiocystis pacifica SIR-1]
MLPPEGPASPADPGPSPASDPELAPPSAAGPRPSLLLASVLVVATCGLVYELITATMASYLLGDSVTQFSLVIGVYLSAMGLGSYLSRFVERELATRFVHVQLIIAVVGGFSAPALFFGFGLLDSIRPLLFAILILVGCCVGLEIPLLMRLMPGEQVLKDLVARVLAFDYIGALLASITFPLLFLPWLGLVRTSLMFGLFNALVALWSARAFWDQLKRPRLILAQGLVVAALCGSGFAFGDRIETLGERSLYDAPVIFSKKTRYQRLTITRWSDDIRLYIDGNLQFSSADEHRYHESLVHPAFAAREQFGDAPAKRVLILGGGDGLAVRELLRYPEIERVDLVDLDPEMTRLFRETPALSALNHGSLADPRVHVHNADAMRWLEEHRSAANSGAGERASWDVIVVDLPDPNNLSLGKLYTRSFYRLVRWALAPDGVAVVQSTSPYLSPRAFWCIVQTLDAADLHPRPYHAHVPSFGDWGYALIARSPLELPGALPTQLPPDERTKLRFLADELVPSLFAFPADQRPPEGLEINRLDTQMLVHYYDRDLASFGPLARRAGS